MTSQEILQADMLDILFEHRNKSYGAYTLRREYNHHLSIALIVAAVIVSLIFFISTVVNNGYRDDPFPGIAKPVVISSTTINPPEKHELPLPPAKPRVAAQKNFQTFKIVPDKNVVDAVPDQKDWYANTISDKYVDGTAGSISANAVNSNGNSGTASIILKDSKNETEFVPVEVPPSFPGGKEALSRFFSRTLRSPAELQAGEKKMVIVRFVVGIDGGISRTEIIQSAGEIYDAEVLRAFRKMPHWNPAIQNGKPVEVSFTQPVSFTSIE